MGKKNVKSLKVNDYLWLKILKGLRKKIKRGQVLACAYYFALKVDDIEIPFLNV